MMKPADKPGILDVLKAINANAESDRRLPDSHLLGTFESMWPKLEQELEEIGRTKLLTRKPQRTDRQLLEEVLDLLRSNQGIGKSLDDETASLELMRKRVIDEFIPPLRKVGGREVTIEIKEKGKLVDVLVLKPEDELSQMERERIETIENRLANYGIALQASYIPF
jgi:vacuolar-type H+-ATPase subunit I/STV1